MTTTSGWKRYNLRYKSIISIFCVTNLFQVAIHDDEYAVASVRLA